MHIPLKSCLSKHENKADDIKLLLKFKRSTSRRLVIAQIAEYKYSSNCNDMYAAKQYLHPILSE
jgi:hypothetical protein